MILTGIQHMNKVIFLLLRIIILSFIDSVMLQRVVLSENQAYASIRNEREHNSTIRIYENMQMHS